MILLFLGSLMQTLEGVGYRDRFGEPIMSKTQALPLSCFQSSGQASLVRVLSQSQPANR